MRQLSRFPNRFSRLTKATALAMSVGAVLSAGSAMAVPVQTLYGGGSTFAAPPYVGADYLNFTPNARLSTNGSNNAGPGFTTAGITTGTIFDVFTATSGNHISYCQTGSGFGKNSLNGAATALANGNCADFSANPAGLSAATSSPDYIGTDAPYSTTDYNAFLASTQLGLHQGIVQIPTIAGAIALPHNDNVDNVALTNPLVCKIYSGMIKNWKGIPGVTGTGAAAPIKIIYRTDGSGTSFAFTRYLAATCNGTPNVPAGFVFTPNQTFSSALPGGVAAVYGTRAIGASGNPGVVSATLNSANGGALGYADIGEVIAQAAGYATVSGFDPAMFGRDSLGAPKPLSISITNLMTGKVLDGSIASDAPGASSPTIKNCLRLVNPSLKLSSTYPIVAITYLNGYYSGNGSASHVTALKTLFNLFYNGATRPALPTGYAYLDGVATFRTSVKATVNACFNK